MDSKHLSDSELVGNTGFTTDTWEDTGRKRNISADSYLTSKKDMQSARGGSTVDSSQRTEELSTLDLNHDASPGNLKDDFCLEISCSSPLPAEIGSIFSEFELTENPKDESDLAGENAWGLDQDSTKKDLLADFVGDESLDSASGDFIMDLSPIELASESMFFDADKPDDDLEDSNKEEHRYVFCAGEKESGVSLKDSSPITTEEVDMQETEGLEEVNVQETEGPEEVRSVEGPEMASPYSAFESVGESIVGQPRCLALKQHSFSIEDCELDFDFEFVEDEPPNVVGAEKKDLEDMFQDDEEVQKSAEIEEGELTSDVNSTTDTKASKAESNLDLFQKVNRCFFRLDKEFNNIRVPRNCRKLIGQLQDTLKIVRRMDRKLSVLIDSVGKNRNRSSDAISKKDVKEKRSDGRVDSRQRERRRDGSRSNKRSEEHSKRRSREGSRSSRKSTPSEGKRERQRIQSLFKRQMSLITSHVIQRNRDLKKRESVRKFPKKDDDDSMNRKVEDLKEMDTLEDMEAFLQRLKEKKQRKPDGSGSSVKQGGLTFTTKKNANSEWRAILEKAREETRNKMAASLLPCSSEKESRNSAEKIIKENGRKMDEEISKNGVELKGENSLEKQMECDSNKPFGAEKENLSRLKNSEEQRCVREKERSVERVELQNGEKVNDSLSARRKNSEEIGPIQESRVSDFESDSGKKANKKRKHSALKSSESDSDRIPSKKRKRSRNGKLSRDRPSRSRRRYHSSARKIDYFAADRSPESINPQNLFIVADKNLSLLDKHVYLTVKGNQIFLETRREEKRKSRKFDRGGTTLQEMEDFLQRLRSKKASAAAQEGRSASPSSLQSKEAKFIARIQAKRKAKLMACLSGAQAAITEKESKVLKDLEMRAREPCDSPETLRKKQELLQKIRAETEAIVTSQKKRLMDDDPVRTLLTMIEDEEGSSKPHQILVSFPLKKTSSSDVRQRMDDDGKGQGLSEESQRFLNSVRAKMRAKKTSSLDTSLPRTMAGEEQKQ